MNRRIAWILAVLLLGISVGAGADQIARADSVLVVKSESRLYLLQDEEIFASYRAVFGGSPKGHKEREGDQRTPEGNYYLTYKNPNSAFYKSIHVSYPNAQDKEHARDLGVDPGGEIMIHGQKNGREWLAGVSRFVNWTDGCIALSNADMEEVWQSIEPGIPIEIKP